MHEGMRKREGDKSFFSSDWLQGLRHLVFKLIASMNEEEPDKTTLKMENRNRNEENRRQIIDFIADNGISDAKTISKAIGLKPSRTRDYLKQLVDEGILEVEGEYKNRKYRIKK